MTRRADLNLCRPVGSLRPGSLLMAQRGNYLLGSLEIRVCDAHPADVEWMSGDTEDWAVTVEKQEGTVSLAEVLHALMADVPEMRRRHPAGRLTTNRAPGVWSGSYVISPPAEPGSARRPGSKSCPANGGGTPGPSSMTSMRTPSGAR